MLRMVNRVRQLRRQAQAWRPAAATPPEGGLVLDLETYYAARYPRYSLAPHVRHLIAHLEALGPGDAIIITIPPRHSKTETVKAWLERELGRHPQADAMYASYAVRLARTSSRGMRNEIASGNAFPRFFPGVRLAADSKSVTDWALTAGGQFRAAGVGGGLTGMGARYGVIDDPFKDRKQAESELVRDGVWEWFTSVFLTRLSPDATLVVMHTRWHPDDLAGRILARLAEGESDELGGLRWSHVNLPALAEEDDPLGRAVGEPLWPQRYGLTRLHGLRAVNEYDFSALFQQRPRKRGGSVFTDQVKRYDTPNLRDAHLVISADLAASKRTSADHTAYHVLAANGRDPDMTGDVLEVRRGRWDIREQIAIGRELQERHGAALHVERSPNAIPVIQQMRAERLNVIEVPAVGDKFSRAQPWASAWNGGRVRLPASAPWVDAYIAEHTSFTGTDADKDDDQVDAAAHGWRIAQRSGAQWGVRGATAG